MYVVCNQAPGPSVLVSPDPRSTVVFVSRVNILIPSPLTPLTVYRTVSQVHRYTVKIQKEGASPEDNARLSQRTQEL